MNSTVNRLISQSPMIVASQMLAAAEGVSVCLPVTEKSCSSRGPTIAVKAALNKIRRVPAIWSALTFVPGATPGPRMFYM